VRAVVADHGAVRVEDRPPPSPQGDELLVAVRAAGLNNADLLQLAGGYPPPAGSDPDRLGLELAGVVVATGERAVRYRTGDRVMAVVSGGGQAELVTVPEVLAMPVPAGLSWAEAGALPEAHATAVDALFTQGQLGPGDRVLVHGAAGGVGTAAVQLAAAAGATVVASVRNPARREDVAALGAVVVDPADFADAGPFDVVLELVGAPNVPGDLAALAVGGRIVVIGLGAGARVEVDLRHLMGRRGRLSASTLRARPIEERAAVARTVERRSLPLVAAGRVRVPLAATVALEQAAEAYDLFARGGKFGKIVLTLEGNEPPDAVA
jgi:NADPH2:quinone reductase